jgi:hypothetical protein
MTMERIRERYEAQPFQPFVLHMADGKEIPVLHREFMASSPTGRTIVVYQPDDTCEIIDLLLVTHISLKSAGVSG